MATNNKMECLLKLSDLALSINYTGKVFCKSKTSVPEEGFSLDWHSGELYSDGAIIPEPVESPEKIRCGYLKHKKFTIFYDETKGRLYVVILSGGQSKTVYKIENLVTVWDEFKIKDNLTDSLLIYKKCKWVYCPPASGGGGNDIYCVETCSISSSFGRIPHQEDTEFVYFSLIYNGTISTYDTSAGGETLLRVSVIKPDNNLENPGHYGIIFYHDFATYLRDYVTNMPSPKKSLRIYFSREQSHQVNILKPGELFLSLILTKESLDTMQYVLRTPVFTAPQQPPFATSHAAVRFDIIYEGDQSDTQTESFTKKTGLYLISDFVHLTENLDLPSIPTNNPALPGDIVTYRDVYTSPTFSPDGIHYTVRCDEADSHIREIDDAGLIPDTSSVTIGINYAYTKLRRIEKFSSSTSPPTSLSVKYYDGALEVLNPNIEEVETPKSFTSEIECSVLSGSSLIMLTDETFWTHGPACQIKFSSKQTFNIDRMAVDVNEQSCFYVDGIFTINFSGMPRPITNSIVQINTSVDTIANVNPVIESLDADFGSHFGRIRFTSIENGNFLTNREFFELFQKPNPVYSVSYQGSFSY